MRVISGALRRRLLKEVPSDKTRSTKDRVKESLFNMLMPLERFNHCLDAFAGSGALGIEALSRGVNRAVFVEKNRQAFAALEANIINLELSHKATWLSHDTVAFMKKTKEKFDLILLDPPYETDLIDIALNVVVENKLLQAEGLMVSLSHKEKVIEAPEALIMTKRRTIGITTVSFYEWSD